MAIDKPPGVYSPCSKVSNCVENDRGIDALHPRGCPRPLSSGRLAGGYARIAMDKEDFMAEEKMKIDLTMYGIAEVLKWCIDRNNGRVAGVDTAGFKQMQMLLAERPQVNDYF